MTGGEAKLGVALTRDSRLAKALRNPLYHSGYALVANTAGTTLVGFLYWALAAHLYSHEAVGRASALVSALVVVSTIAQLNLASTLPRFLPYAKRRAGRLIVLCYSANSIAAAIGGVVFVLLIPKVSSNWEFVQASAPIGALFILAAAIWGVFALEDAALTGLQRSVVVPIENTGYGVVKLILLAAVASLMPSSGIFFSWIAPLVICVPVINWLIFMRYLPARDTAREVSEVTSGVIMRFAGLDYVGSLFAMAYTNLPPLLVLTVLGPIANGYFYIAWTIGAGMSVLAGNFSANLLIEAAAAPERLAELTRGVLVRCFVVLVPTALVLVIGSRLFLGLYGSGYADHAATVLALLAVAAIPRSMVLLAVSLDRVARRVGRGALTHLGVAILVIGGSWLLLKSHGIDGVGLAWLFGNLIIALVRLPTLVAAARRPHNHAAPTAHHDPGHQGPPRVFGQPQGRHRGRHAATS
jgi:O-antigen/teichoic acid export membrane protein